MSRFYTQTCVHLRNPGDGLVVIASGIECTPADPVPMWAYTQAYPIDKLYALKQVYTAYSGFAPGDYMDLSSVRYAVKIVNRWEELDFIPTYYQLGVEETIDG